jgi:hypothetical protein
MNVDEPTLKPRKIVASSLLGKVTQMWTELTFEQAGYAEITVDGYNGKSKDHII